MRLSWLFRTVVAVAIGLTGSLGTATAQESIKIGWIGHLTGFLSAYSKDMLTGAEMAIADVNAAGGVLGRKLELVVRDDRGNAGQAVTTMRELDAQEKVVVVAGTLSSDVSRAMRGYAEANKLPYISTSSGDASITAPGTKWTARIQPPAAVQGAAMSKFALDQNPTAKIAVLRADILYFPEVMNGAIWYMEQSGKGELVYNKYFPPRQADFNVVAAQLKEAKPDYVLFAFNSPGLENFIRAALGAGLKPEQLICFTVQTAPAQKALGKDIIGTYAATFFDEALRGEFPKAGEVADRFYKQRGYYPGYIAGHASGNIKMIAAALESAGKVDRSAFAKALRGGTDLVDAAGRKLTFDADGRNTLNTVYIVQATDFNAKRLATFKLASSIRFDPAEVPALELSNVRK